MAVKIDFKTLLMKIVNVFPKDMYLVHNWCAIAGAESDLENRGFYFCILTPQVRELLTQLFPNNPVLYIKSVRETKADLSKIEEILDAEAIKNIENIVNTNLSEMNKVAEWSTFNFTDEEIDSLFKEGRSLTLNENEDSSVIISKSIFPLITEKTINDVTYAYTSYDTDGSLNQVIMCYDYELFQFVMRYLYIKL